MLLYITIGLFYLDHMDAVTWTSEVNVIYSETCYYILERKDQN
jgi:hypothetical protein